MKREIMIAIISILAQTGAAFLVFAWYALRTSGDYLIGVILAGAVAFLAGLVVYAVLDVNLKGTSKWKKKNYNQY